MMTGYCTFGERSKGCVAHELQVFAGGLEYMYFVFLFLCSRENIHWV